jgi:hypothetical protein
MEMCYLLLLFIHIRPIHHHLAEIKGVEFYVFLDCISVYLYQVDMPAVLFITECTQYM